MEFIDEFVSQDGKQRVYRLPSEAYWLCYWTFKNGYVSWGLYQDLLQEQDTHHCVGVGPLLGHGFVDQDVAGFWELLTRYPEAAWASLVL